MGFGYLIGEHIRKKDRERGYVNECMAEDLSDRAYSLTQRTGVAPMSWDAFKAEKEKHDPSTRMRTTLVGAAIGAAIAIGMTLIFAAAATSLIGPLIAGAALGAIAGGCIETPNNVEYGQLRDYRRYLEQFEAMGGHGQKRTQQVSQTTTTHAADLVASRAQEHQAGRGA